MLATWEAEIGRTEAWGQPRQNSSWDPLSPKITSAKCSQAVDQFLCKNEAFSSNDSPTK
jgi:hypothetical protein